MNIAPASIKLCSLRSPIHAEWAAAAGSSMIGLIFAPARRQVDPETAREIVQSLRSASPNRTIHAVGVFVDASADEINRIAARVGLDIAQLQGAESPELVAQLDLPAIKAIQPRPDETLPDIDRIIERYARSVVSPIAFHVDGYHPDAPGGHGGRADWTLAADLARCWPVILAGGLTPDNVAVAIEQVRPLVVDVSSGVEIDGEKDRAKFETFVANARAAFARLNRNSDLLGAPGGGADQRP